MIALLIPVLGRPQNAQPLVDSIHANTRTEHNIVFLASRGDDDQIEACRRTNALTILVEGGDCEYARKINEGCTLDYWGTPPEWVFLGADDLDFHDGWDLGAIAEHERTGKPVIGTNDLANPTVMAGRHSTHTLVHRSYVERGSVDDPAKLLHDGYSHNWCNPPEAPIWMADLSFKALGDVKTGDAVVGWEREGQFNRLRVATVLDTLSRDAPVVRVIMESGRELRCTPDHLWLNAAWSPASSHDATWVNAQRGRQLLHVASPAPPVPPELVRLAGWMAGIYDGEGSGVYVALQSAAKNPEIVAAIVSALNALGIPHTQGLRKSGIAEFILTGGRQAYLDFLLRVQPVKRERLVNAILNGRRDGKSGSGAARFGHRDRVVHMENELSARREVVSLKTTTGNYVAWGYASKNCDNEFIDTARFRDAFSFAAESHVAHRHPIWHTAPDDGVYAKGRAGFHKDRRLYLSRRRLWTPARS